MLSGLTGLDPPFALRRVTYVGEDANESLRKRTKEAVFLSICRRLVDEKGEAVFLGVTPCLALGIKGIKKGIGNRTVVVRLCMPGP